VAFLRARLATQNGEVDMKILYTIASGIAYIGRMHST